MKSAEFTVNVPAKHQPDIHNVMAQVAKMRGQE